MKITRSIYFRLALAFLVLISCIGLLQLFLATRSLKDITALIEQRRNWEIARFVADRVQTSVYPTINIEQTTEKLIELNELNPSLRMALLDTNGKVLTYAPQDFLWNPEITDLPRLKEALGINNPDLPLYSQLRKQAEKGGIVQQDDYLFSISEIQLPEGKGFIYIWFELFTGTKFEKVGTFSLTRLTVAGFIAILALAFAFGAIAFAIITRRFRKVAEVLQQFASGDYSPRLRDSNQDEIGQIAKAIDLLADTVVAAKTKLIERDSQRRDLVANITHDLRNPLTAMRIQLDTLRTKIKQNPTATWEQGLPEIQVLVRNTELQQRLVLDLFELSKLEATQKVVWDEISIPQSATEVISRMRPSAELANLTLTMEQSQSLEEAIADKALLERAMANLIENAIRYTPSGGKIILRVSGTETGYAIEVQDSGQGIPTQLSQSLFEPGVKGENSPGAGLGLAIVSRIAEIHRGVLSCNSKTGEGTTMRIDLPYEPVVI